MTGTLYIDNDNNAQLSGVRNAKDQIPDLGANVSVTVYDSGGNPVSGETWPVTLDHTADATYCGTMASTMVLVRKRKYTARIIAVGSNGEVGQWDCKVEALPREC